MDHSLLFAWIDSSVGESSPIPPFLAPVSTFRDHVWLLTVMSACGHTGTCGNPQISNLRGNMVQIHGNYGKHKLRRHCMNSLGKSRNSQKYHKLPQSLVPLGAGDPGYNPKESRVSVLITHSMIYLTDSRHEKQEVFTFYGEKNRTL